MLSPVESGLKIDTMEAMLDTRVAVTTDGRILTPTPTPLYRPKYTVRKASALMAEVGVCFAIYGPPGAGKSTLAAQAADTDWGTPVGVIDAEGGFRAYGDKDIDVFSVKDSDDKHDSGMGFSAVESILDDLVAGKLVPDRPRHDGKLLWGTIIVDNVSEVNTFCTYDTLRTVKRNIGMDDRPDQKDWGTTTSRMLLLIRRFRDFAQATGTNVIFIAWDRAQEDKVTGVTKKDVAFNPALANQFPGLLDVVGYLTIDKKGIRKLSFEASNTSAAKFRRNQSEAAMSIPAEFIYAFTDPHKPMVDLLNCLKGGVTFPRGRYKEAGGAMVARAAATPTSGQSTADYVRGVIVNQEKV